MSRLLRRQPVSSARSCVQKCTVTRSAAVLAACRYVGQIASDLLSLQTGAWVKRVPRDVPDGVALALKRTEYPEYGSHLDTSD